MLGFIYKRVLLFTVASGAEGERIWMSHLGSSHDMSTVDYVMGK